MPAPLLGLALRFGARRNLIQRATTAHSAKNELKTELPAWFKPVADVAVFATLFYLLKPRRK